jgi:serine/threonine protein kinase
MGSPQFNIEQKLNESATTVVYRAFDTVLHRTVLLKVLHSHLANDKELTGRFTREARACAALRSEHIVQIYDLTEYDGAPAIVMEYVEGRSLKEVIAAGADRSPEFAATVARHVLRALSVAHERGIIHRDIKPGNILVSDSGTVKVTDFGLAYVALSPTMTMEGMVLGTPAYMAPEQVRGDDVDHRTDLFALGLTVVETLTGERIFEGATYSECMKKVLAFKVQDLDRFIIPVASGLSPLLSVLLRPVKEERCPSAKDALVMLDGGTPGTSVAGTTQGVRPKKRMLVSIGIAILAVVTAVVIGMINRPTPTAEIQGTEVPLQPTQTAAPPESIKTIPEAKKVSPDIPDQLMEKRSSSATPITAVRDSGRLFVTSSPWAKVYVDNQLIGETPMSMPVQLPSGTHAVMFANPSFEPIVRTVTIEPGRDVTVNGDFLVSAGYLLCVVKPWAEVFVNEQYKDTTPLSKPLMLSPGRYTVRFHNAAFPDIIREITVRSKDTTTVTVSFTP